MPATQTFLSTPSKATNRLAPVLRTFLNSLQEHRVRTATDRALTRRIRAVVEDSLLNIRGLSIYVHDGSVDVYGTIESDTRREDMLSLVAEQPGAKRITDHLELPGA